MAGPPNEGAARITGPDCCVKTRRVCATSSASDISGFCTAVAVTPAPCRRLITSDQEEPSAYAPWTSTTLGLVLSVEVMGYLQVQPGNASVPASGTNQRTIWNPAGTASLGAVPSPCGWSPAATRGPQEPRQPSRSPLRYACRPS